MTASSASVECSQKGAHCKMKKRAITIGDYNTALTGLWTLTAWELSEAELVEDYVEVPGHSGLLDFSTVLTDGEPCYGNRSLTVTLESSEGTRLEREARINEMVNRLDGLRHEIVLPDDPQHYLTGRVRVKKLYNDTAHASVQVTATCEPWRYNRSETVLAVSATQTEQVTTLINPGRLPVVPTIQVTGSSVSLRLGNASQAFSAGTYIWPELYLRRGSTALRYQGSGTAIITYREAVL